MVANGSLSDRSPAQPSNFRFPSGLLCARVSNGLPLIGSKLDLCKTLKFVEPFTFSGELTTLPITDEEREPACPSVPQSPESARSPMLISAYMAAREVGGVFSSGRMAATTLDGKSDMGERTNSLLECEHKVHKTSLIIIQ